MLNKSWRQHPTRHQLYGHLPPITKTIQARRNRHAGQYWRSRDELTSDVFLWTPHMAEQKQDDQLEHTFSSYVWIRDVALNTCKRPWTIGRVWRERVRGIRACGMTWWWWWYIYIGWNEKNSRPRKDDMILFLFNENQFSFFVADHLLVGQLCTNLKSDRRLLSCLKMTHCSTSEIGDAPQYNSYSLPIQVMTTGPLPASSKCKSGRFNAWGHSSTHRTTHRTATVMAFVVVLIEGHIRPPNIFEVSLKVNTKLYLDLLRSVVIPCCNQVAGGRPRVWQQNSVPAHKSKETLAWLQKEWYDFVPFSHWPPSFHVLNPLDYFVWS